MWLQKIFPGEDPTPDPPNFRFASLVIGLENPCVPLRPPCSIIASPSLCLSELYVKCCSSLCPSLPRRHQFVCYSYLIDVKTSYFISQSYETLSRIFARSRVTIRLQNAPPQERTRRKKCISVSPKYRSLTAYS